MYTFANRDTFIIVGPDAHGPLPFLILRDKKDDSAKLEKLFKSSHKIFRVRTRDLGNLQMETSEEDADALRIMLEGLIVAKKRLRH